MKKRIIFFVIVLVCTPFLVSRLFNDVRLFLFSRQLWDLSSPPKIEVVKITSGMEQYPLRPDCIFTTRAYLKTNLALDELEMYYREQLYLGKITLDQPPWLNYEEYPKEVRISDHSPMWGISPYTEENEAQFVFTMVSVLFSPHFDIRCW